MATAATAAVLRAIKPHKETATHVELVELTPKLIKSWVKPDFQRDLRVNAKVLELVEKLKVDGGVVPGIITIGVLDKTFYKLDGQHRLEAFLLSELLVGYADVRYYYADDMAEMGEEFVRLNSSLVRLRPDDILRGLEGTNAALQYIRKHCPFVGYDMVRRNSRSPIMSMSVMLRCWTCSAAETPTSGGGTGAIQIARALSPEDAKNVSIFITLVEKAWGRDPEYARLFGGLNMTLCMWIFRRMVLEPSKSSTVLTPDEFRIVATALSADAKYLDYIVGRKLSDRDRSPAYNKIKTVMQRRYQLEAKRKARFPQPPWASNVRGGE